MVAAICCYSTDGENNSREHGRCPARFQFERVNKYAYSEWDVSRLKLGNSNDGHFVTIRRTRPSIPDIFARLQKTRLRPSTVVSVTRA